MDPEIEKQIKGISEAINTQAAQLAELGKAPKFDAAAWAAQTAKVDSLTAQLEKLTSSKPAPTAATPDDLGFFDELGKWLDGIFA